MPTPRPRSTTGSRTRPARAANDSTPHFPLGGRLRGVEQRQLPLLALLGIGLLAVALLVSSLGAGSARVIAGWPGLRPAVPVDLATYPDAAYLDGRLYLPSSTPLRGSESLDAGWLVADLVSAARSELDRLINDAQADSQPSAVASDAATPEASTDAGAPSSPSGAPSDAPSDTPSGTPSGTPTPTIEIDDLANGPSTWISTGGDQTEILAANPLAVRLQALAKDETLRAAAVFTPAERILLLQIDAGAASETDTAMPRGFLELEQRALYRDGYAPFGCTVLSGAELSALRTTLAETLRGAAFAANDRRIALFSRPLLAGEPDPCTAGGLDTVPEREVRLTALRCERLAADCRGRALAGVTVRAYPINPDDPQSPPAGAEPTATALSDADGLLQLTLPAGGWVLFFDPPTGLPEIGGPEPGFWLLDLRGQASGPLTVRFGAE